MSEVEFLDGLLAQMLEVGRDDRKFLQRVGFEPRSEIRLNRDRARLADLGNIAVDADDAFLESPVRRL